MSGQVASFRSTIFAQGGSTIFVWGAQRDPVMRISAFAHRFRPKKKSSSSNLSLRHGLHTCFRTRTKTLLTLGGRHKQHFEGAQAPKCTIVAPGWLLCYKTRQILAWGGGTSNDLESTAPKYPASFFVFFSKHFLISEPIFN